MLSVILDPVRMNDSALIPKIHSFPKASIEISPRCRK